MSDESPVRRFVRVVSSKLAGERLDVYMWRGGAGISRSQCTRCIRDGGVTVNGRRVRPSYKVRVGDEIVAEYEAKPEFRVEAEEIPLDVVYEDDDLVVLNKPAGMVVHPAKGNLSGTLVNAMLGHVGSLPAGSDRTRPGVVHRLDKDTSGLMMMAKGEEAAVSLSRQIASREVKREYRALVWGTVSRRGHVETPFGRHTIDRKRMSVTVLPGNRRPPKLAVTDYEVVERFEGVATLLSVRLMTGRTHQIRVHMEYTGHPVVGDPVYSGRKPHAILSAVPHEGRERAAALLKAVKRQLLHAARLSFLHPISGEPLAFESPLPEDFAGALSLLGGERAEG